MAKKTFTEYVLENGKRNRFFIVDFEDSIFEPIVSRSALDAIENVNEELCDTLNKLSYALKAVHIKGDHMSNYEIVLALIEYLNNLGYVVIARKDNQTETVINR